VQFYYIWTNNPIYPLYDNLINQDRGVSNKNIASHLTDTTRNTSNTITKKAKGHWGPFAIRKVVYGEKWWETAVIPVRVFFQGKDNNPKLFDGRLNPYLLFLTFFAFINFNRQSNELRTEKKIFLIFVLWFLLYAFVQTDMRIRYIAPIIPPLVILSVLGLYEIITVINKKYSGNTRALLKGCIFAFVAYLVSLNAFYIIDQFRIVQPMSYISGRVERDEYIERYRPEYGAINYANHNTASNAKILCLFLGNRGYYFEREYAFSFDMVSKAVLQEKSSENILRDLESRRITHILVRYDFYNKWIGDKYSSMEKEVISNFFKKHAGLLFSKNGHGLYRLEKQAIEDG